MEFEKSMAVTIKGIQNVSREVSSAAEQVAASSNDLADGAATVSYTHLGFTWM